MSSKLNKLEINITSQMQSINKPKKPNFDDPELSLKEKEKSNDKESESLIFERTKEEDEEIQKLEKIYQDKLKEIEHLTNEIKIKDDEIILMNNAKNKIYNIGSSNPNEENKNLGAYAFEIENFNYLNSIEAFKEGKFYVQDLSSMMVAEYAMPQKNDYVIDVCAAPGGKSLHIAEMLDGTGMVEARDLTEYKVGLIEENIKRHKATNVKAIQWDATVLDENAIDKADVLICDLPCSGLGVLAKKPDIRYRMSLEQQKELSQLQKEILSKVVNYVKPGKTMIYSTCTINPDENEKNVQWILDNYPQMKLVEMKQIFPSERWHDGFFIAKFNRPL